MSLIKIVIYVTGTEKEPYSLWEDSLDRSVQIIVKNRLDRIRLGNFGDVKPVKGSKTIWEIRIDYGPGYRIYFGKINVTTIILLIGGEKKGQDRDIEKAKRYWQDCEELL